MRRTDADALAVWDARARTVLGRIDAMLETNASFATSTVTDTIGGDWLDALAARAARRQSPPPGEILRPEVPERPMTPAAPPRAPNMGPPPTRVDHWDAYVCRFEDDGDDSDWLRPAP